MRGVNFARGAVGLFEDDVGIGKSLCDVAAFDFASCAGTVAALLHGRCTRLQRLLHIDDGRQDLVLHLDRAHRVPGLLRSFSGDRGDLFALEPAVGVEQTAGCAARGWRRIPGDLRFLVRIGEHRAHARHLPAPSLASTRFTMACPCGQRRMAACSMSGRVTSSGYTAVPLTRS